MGSRHNLKGLHAPHQPECWMSRSLPAARYRRLIFRSKSALSLIPQSGVGCHLHRGHRHLHLEYFLTVPGPAGWRKAALSLICLGSYLVIARMVPWVLRLLQQLAMSCPAKLSARSCRAAWRLSQRRPGPALAQVCSLPS